MKKIYIAGFDVFKPDSKDIGQRYKLTCKEYGYEGLYPLDNEIDVNWDKKRAREFIYENNIDLIKKADIIIANANPFRGEELDSGTAFEIGYGLALGKKVILYMSDTRAYKQKLTCKGLKGYDDKGMFIEDFDFPLNLMFSECSIIQGGFQEAVKFLAAP